MRRYARQDVQEVDALARIVLAPSFALARLTSVIDKLVVYPENMRKNLDLLGGLHNSQRMLLALTQAGDEPDTDPVARQVVRAYELAFARSPDADELTEATAVVREHGLATLCRVIFNANEFLFLP